MDSIETFSNPVTMQAQPKVMKILKWKDQKISDVNDLLEELITHELGNYREQDFS